MIWKHYPDIDPISRLYGGKYQLIGRSIDFTVKRDGSNISFWYDEKNSDSYEDYLEKIGVKKEVLSLLDSNIHISSHNQETLDNPKVYEHIVDTNDYNNIVKMIYNLKDKDYIFYFELMQPGKTPTQVEEPVKKSELIMLDVLDTKTDKFLEYDVLLQYHSIYYISIASLLETLFPTSKEELDRHIEELMDWCKSARREGVVGKIYYNPGGPQIFFKEKITIPKPKKEHKHEENTLPEMDEHTKQRAIEHTIDEITKIAKSNGKTVEEIWKDRKITMPILAKHIRLEAREHDFKEPNAYNLYLSIAPEKINNKR
jgi:hypothetical protein